jgi:hypothetical protein
MIFPIETVLLETGCIACINSKGKLNTKRPMLVRHRGKKWTAHRLSFHLNVKKIPRWSGTKLRGLICHTCDNGWCVNPKHLYFGTQKDNMQDRLARHPTFREKIRKTLTGYKHSPEARANMAKAKAGTKPSKNCLVARWSSQEQRDAARARALAQWKKVKEDGSKVRL